MKREHAQFHLQFFPPSGAWPNGGWSIYEISCDDIARRIGFDAEGNVSRRESWPGYVGTFATLPEVAAVLEDRTKA